MQGSEDSVESSERTNPLATDAWPAVRFKGIIHGVIEKLDKDPSMITEHGLA